MSRKQDIPEGLSPQPTPETAASVAALSDALARRHAFAETTIAREVTARLDFARRSGALVTIGGPPGIGKTTAVKRYAAKHRNVWRCETTIYKAKSVHGTLSVIAEALGFGFLEARPSALGREIERALYGTHGVLIIDEAHNLKRDGMETLRGLWDQAREADDRIGLVLVGHCELREKVARLPQLASRVDAPLWATTASGTDADAMFDAWGLRCAASRRFLRSFASGAMGLRRIAKAYDIALDLAFADGTPVSSGHVRAAWDGLAGGMAA